MPTETIDQIHLRRAARLAWRGHGGAEPNPMVGCVIVDPAGETVGWGYHRRCGEAHAEIHALRRAGTRARGATAYVTLEPCLGSGRTGPCAEALVEAGVRRVVIARRDPHPKGRGGLERLREAGLEVAVVDGVDAAVSVSDPFVRRVETGLPWVVVKWAQTIDGRIATRTGESRWISNDLSRRLVHRERGRTDVILTGIGTLLIDDPMLTARFVRTRRVARRLVIDPRLETPLHARVVETASEVPTHIACSERVLANGGARVDELRARGVDLIGAPLDQKVLSMAPVLRDLADRFDATNVLVEAGPGLLGRLFQQRLVSEAWVFIAPLLLGDANAPNCVSGLKADRLTDGVGLEVRSVRRRGDDVVVRYRVQP